MKPVYIADYNYPLPDDRIAKYPLAERDTSKLLVYRDGQVTEDQFLHIGNYINPQAVLIYNNTRVIQARLVFRKLSGARIEIFCLEPLTPTDYQLSLTATTGCVWKCMVGNAKKFNMDFVSMTIEPLGIELRAYKQNQTGNTFAIRFAWDNTNITFAQILDAVGELPIPPYLNRKTEPNDLKTYQTVYSKIKGSVAAPTAGLHFTQRVLDDLHQRGIHTYEVTLHVGAGTFLPVKAEDANDHTMHSEVISVSRQTIAHIQANIGHIVAVGTTSMRTLESLYFIGAQLHATQPNEEQTEIHVQQFEPYEKDHTLSAQDSMQAILDYLDRTQQSTLHAATQIMIKPGYTFRIVNQLITNFHQPQSTLLLLVSAFVGGDWHTIYDYALAHNFRFLSYGDSSILTLTPNH